MPEPNIIKLWAIKPTVTDIPTSLQQIARWAVYIAPPARHNPAKRAKIPVHPGTGRKLSTTRAKEWSTFEQACEAVKHLPPVDDQPIEGVCLCLTGLTDLAVVDIDGKDLSDVDKILSDVFGFVPETFIEKSPSGRGLHVFIRLPKGHGLRSFTNHSAGVELYTGDSGRHITLTGVMQTPTRTVEPVDLTGFLEKWAQPSKVASDHGATVPQPVISHDRPALPPTLDDVTVTFLDNGEYYPDKDGSASLMAAACRLYRKGLDDSTVLGILAHSVGPIEVAGKDHRRPGSWSSQVSWIWDHTCTKARASRPPETPFEALPPIDGAEWQDDDADAPDDPSEADIDAYLGDLQQVQPVEDKKGLFAGPTRSRIRADLMSRPPPSPRFVIANFLPVDVSVFVAPGGTGKSTLEIQEGIHIILGKPVYGMPIAQQGSVLYISGEDSREIFEHRLYQMMTHLELTAGERRAVLQAFYFEDLSADDSKLVGDDGSGNMRYNSEILRDLHAAYKDSGLARVSIDPMVSFGGPEAAVNDSVQALVKAGRWLVSALRCAVKFVHHTGQQVHRDKIIDLYSGRGGSALGDGARMVSQLVRHDKGDDGFPAPRHLDDLVVRDGNLFRLHLTKLSHAAKPWEFVWLEREGWEFRHHVALDADEVEKQQQETKATQFGDAVFEVVNFIRNSETPVFMSVLDAAELKRHNGVKIPRKEKRYALDQAIVQKLVEKTPTPPALGIRARHIFVVKDDNFPI